MNMFVSKNVLFKSRYYNRMTKKVALKKKIVVKKFTLPLESAKSGQRPSFVHVLPSQKLSS